jgi:hypothetical protein
MERDHQEDEPVCFYCQQQFIENDTDYCKEWEHLNNNTGDNRPENLVWAHAKCNELKKKNFDWQFKAHEKLKKNVIWHSESLGGRGEKEAKTTHTQAQPNEQIDANADAISVCEQYIAERLLPHFSDRQAAEKELDWTDTEDALSFLCYKKFRHGSQNTIRRYLKLLTSGPAPFKKESRDGRDFIIRRTEN